MREGEDGRVHELPHPRVALLLAGAEPQVRNLRPGQRESKGDSAKLKANRTSAVWPDGSEDGTDLSDNLDEVFGTERAAALQLASAGL